VPINSQCTLLGPYDIPSYESEFTAVFTNKTLVTPVRGAGRQHGVFVIERLLDFAARELGLDRAEIRRKNLLRPDQFPFNNEILFQDSAPLTYDSGDYEPASMRRSKASTTTASCGRSSRGSSGGAARGNRRGVLRRRDGDRTLRGRARHHRAGGRVRLATGVGTQGRGTSPCSPRSSPRSWAWTRERCTS